MILNLQGIKIEPNWLPRLHKCKKTITWYIQLSAIEIGQAFSHTQVIGSQVKWIEKKDGMSMLLTELLRGP